MPTVILDFDGVIHSYESGWKGADVIPDQPVIGAFAAIRSYLDAGLDVAVFSSRSNQEGGIEAMRSWFGKWGGGDIPSRITFPNHKPPAIVSIDDRAICFDGEFPSPEHIRNFKTWQDSDV